MTEREVRVTVHAPGHLTLTEIAEMFWDKLDRPDSVFEVCAIAVASETSCIPMAEDAVRTAREGEVT